MMALLEITAAVEILVVLNAEEQMERLEETGAVVETEVLQESFILRPTTLTGLSIRSTECPGKEGLVEILEMVGIEASERHFTVELVFSRHHSRDMREATELWALSVALAARVLRGTPA